MIIEGSREIFESREHPDQLVREGETVVNFDFADFLEALAIEGEGLFYRGEVSALIDPEVPWRWRRPKPCRPRIIRVDHPLSFGN